MQATNTDFCQLVAAAADICRKPYRHAVRVVESPVVSDSSACASLDFCLQLEVRTADGQRLREQDLDLDVFQSGQDFNLTISWCVDQGRPLLWQGSHSVWMNGQTGERCSRPEEGIALESLARRLRSLLMGMG